jgi:excinuclease ABC subunit C
MYLVQRVRDEAHRFAITFHRQKRSKRMTTSALDDVPGLGQTRKTALLKHFGSLKRLRSATVEQISEVPGVGRRTAQAVHSVLTGSLAGSAGTESTVAGSNGHTVGEDDSADGTGGGAGSLAGQSEASTGQWGPGR